MTKEKKQGLLAIALILLIVFLDQWIKFYVKMNFMLYESYEVTSWFSISFIENNGMAYGMELGSKLFLTIFRIVAVGVFGYYLFTQIRKKKASYFFAVCFSMVIAGAIGNLVDCIFYGRWFTESNVNQIAQWADADAGLLPSGEWLEGRVVDMFHFNLIEFNWPESWYAAGETASIFGWQFAWPSWLPCSDETFKFFKPVFNFADAAISVGMAVLVFLYMRSAWKLRKAKKKDEK